MVVTVRSVVKSLLNGTAIAGLLASSAWAAPKTAVVFSDGAENAADAIAMSEVLLGLGFDVTRFDSPDDAARDAAILAAARHAGPAVVYTDGVAVDIAEFASTHAPRFVFVADCGAAEVTDLPINILHVAPDIDCAGDVAATLQEWLLVPGLRTDQWLSDSGLNISSTLEEPYVFRQAASDVRLSAADYALLDTLSPEARARMISLWREAGIVVDVAETGPVVVAPVRVATDTVQVIAPVRPTVTETVVRPVAPAVSSGAQVVTQPPPDTPATGGDGFPAPSILVGFVVDAITEAPDVPEAPVAGDVFSSDDIAAREDLRAQDEALFAGLVETGAFDPPAAEINRALQVELARLNCYTSGIDGAWGPGSERALAAFYTAANAEGGSAPTLAAFRDVVAANGVRCPDVVVAQPVQRAQPAAPRQAAAPARQTRPAATPAPAPAPAPAPSTPRRSINQTGGSGIFR